ncbi:MAG: amidohydrolase [Clostridia bacterium]|nr:amidohydrolase [Clostridia bacterium]
MDNLSLEQLSWFQTIHRNPELGLQEKATTRLVRDVLTSHGLTERPSPLPTGCIFEVGHGDGPVIGIRADMDALPIQEESGLPYASEVPGKMHACGHDFHTAALMGTALLLKGMEDDLPGKAVLIFQPAEEITTGGKIFAQSDVLRDVTAFLSLHTYPAFPVGTLGIKEGPVMASVDQFTVHIHGKGTHAGLPHKGVDPIPVTAQLVMALQTIVSRKLNPFDDALLSITHMEAGNTWNVIPEQAILEGTIRTFDDAVRSDIKQKMEEMCSLICRSQGCTCEVEFIEGPPALQNDPALCEIAREVALEDGFTVDRQEDTMGGEDFAEYLRFPAPRPGFFVRIGTGLSFPNHHPKFVASPDALYPASCYLRDLAVRLMVRL